MLDRTQTTKRFSRDKLPAANFSKFLKNIGITIREAISKKRGLAFRVFTALKVLNRTKTTKQFSCDKLPVVNFSKSLENIGIAEGSRKGHLAFRVSEPKKCSSIFSSACSNESQDEEFLTCSEITQLLSKIIWKPPTNLKQPPSEPPPRPPKEPRTNLRQSPCETPQRPPKEPKKIPSTSSNPRKKPKGM